MRSLYTYIVKVDSGLAPNPFWNWCSLSVCTPNHQGACVKPGDWIAGFSPKRTGYKFIYAMEVDERIHMNNYFHDARFQSKKPNMGGDWKARCGDNLYHQDESGKWHQLPNPFHQGLLEQDTRKPYVFVGHKFWYLGNARVDTPEKFLPLVGGRGVRVNHPVGLPEKFMQWVSSTFQAGVSANPQDAESCMPNKNKQRDCRTLRARQPLL